PLPPHSFPTRRSSDLVHGLPEGEQLLRVVVLSQPVTREHDGLDAQVRNRPPDLLSGFFKIVEGNDSGRDKPVWILLLGGRSGVVDRKSTRLNSSHDQI